MLIQLSVVKKRVRITTGTEHFSFLDSSVCCCLNVRAAPLRWTHLCPQVGFVLLELLVLLSCFLGLLVSPALLVVCSPLSWPRPLTPVSCSPVTGAAIGPVRGFTCSGTPPCSAYVSAVTECVFVLQPHTLMSSTSAKCNTDVVNRNLTVCGRSP